MIRCIQCGAPYPEEGLPFICPSCNGLFDFVELPHIDNQLIEQDLPGIWKYRHTFDDGMNVPILSLGEGNTPLVADEYEGMTIGYKLEGTNPSGSYKDRVVSVIMSKVLSRGITEAVEDSSGNAGAAFAAYGARAGIGATVFFPASHSLSKARQIKAYGAKLRLIEGPRSAASDAVFEAAKSGVAYASHAYLPCGSRGIATMAYELWEQYGKTAPGTIISPVGHGHLLRGIMDGFGALKNSGYIENEPYYVGVQPENCAPVWTAWKHGLEAMASVVEKKTIAEGTNIVKPLQAAHLIKRVKGGRGEFITVSEEEILAAFYELAKRGIYAEPTSAMTWGALKKIGHQLPQPIVLILTGTGLKYTIKN
ncbi:MAG: pyridoxal-phosphate dependent enzyme [Anaerolineaceae bacterium]|nr:pyridoxal-phosphate dependent enzyme [Anaerolineaceae bacterium]